MNSGVHFENERKRSGKKVDIGRCDIVREIDTEADYATERVVEGNGHDGGEKRREKQGKKETPRVK